MSCSRDAEHCNRVAGAHGAPEAVAVWAAGRGASGHCERCGGFLTAEGVCHNPRCGVLTASLAGGGILGVVDTDEGKGICPQCGGALSVGGGEEDWCVNCMEIVTATDRRSYLLSLPTIDDYARTARDLQDTSPGNTRRLLQQKLKSVGYGKVKLALRSVGVPSSTPIRTMAITNMVWQYLDRCPTCKAWISPQKGICNNPRCEIKGTKVGRIRPWPPQQVHWIRRKAQVGKVVSI